MRTYIYKAIFLAVALLISLYVADNVLELSLSVLSYTSLLFILGVFVLNRYFTEYDAHANENKRIRRLMIGSMLRLFFIVIYLAISLFNMSKIDLHFVVVYGLYFLFYLFFDILEMRINLRLDSEKSVKNTNA